MIEHIEEIKKIAIEAGEAILSVYKTNNFDVEIKSDNSPLTEADKQSHIVINKGLHKLFKDIPILSEEGRHVKFETRSKWKKYWLIDPLDGTKEFINKNGEFTVNIALISDNIPVFGIIYAPVLKEIYWGETGQGAFVEQPGETPATKLPTEELPSELTAVASRSHSSKEEKELLQKLNIKKVISKGSSLKFCLLASGKAHYYVRFGPTMEWDTGAGHAIISSAGASLTKITGESFTYNKPNLLNPGFIVTADLLTAQTK